MTQDGRAEVSPLLAESTPFVKKSNIASRLLIGSATLKKTR